MELRRNGVLYEFEFDFAPADETGGGSTTTRSGRVLAGSIHVTAIFRNGRLTPVSAERLADMVDAAAEATIAEVASWYRDRRKQLRARHQAGRRLQAVAVPRG